MNGNSETSQNKRHRLKKSWDPFLVTPVCEEEEKTGRCVLIFSMVVWALAGLLVLASGFFSKVSLLFVVAMTNEDSLNLSNKPFGTLIIGIMLVIPSILTFIKSMWKLIFTHSPSPHKCDVFTVCIIEALVALGSAMLVVVAMPHFNIISNLMILSSVYTIPSAVQIINRARSPNWKMSIPIISLVLLIIGHILFCMGYLLETGYSLQIYVSIAIVATILVSLTWFENLLLLLQKTTFHHVEPEHDTRNVLYICSSVVRIAVTAAVVGSCVPLSRHDWTQLKSIAPKDLQLLLILLAIQAVTSATCHWFGVIACKMHYVKRGFAGPLIMTTPAVCIALFIVFIDQYRVAAENFGNSGDFNITIFCQNLKLSDKNSMVQNLLLEVGQSMCKTLMELNTPNIVMLFISGIAWYLGFVLCTLYVWKLKVQRIERTTQLFVRRLYEAAYIDQSMLLNTRYKLESKEKFESKENQSSADKVMVYLCATMWHETFDEMLKILTSLFRLDKYKSNKKDTLNLEAHIFFDDAFTEDIDTQTGKKKRHVNVYVEYLISAFEEVHRVFACNRTDVFSGNNISGCTQQKIMMTPYGGRLCYILPHGNLLYVHLKDKQRIRHKKRWSQIMYMFYLLGWKLYRKYDNLAEKALNPIEKEQVYKELEKEKHNTYVLALDGDTDFQPSSLLLLVDRLKRYPGVGAACGRIHPTGMGPMVWYQKFEYAVGHWLQKSSEHVFGCVLCSPGCFSLFRASALMDDNVLKKYSTKAAEAAHYVQYDQGEDRWLCTLLLQQGWRVEYNAASDAYTNAPQEFVEFYNQRRRWGPSTMANTLDLLHTGVQTAKKNPSLSLLYILYQTLFMGASILSPATVCLMIAGAFSFVFGLGTNLSLFLAVLPPAIYILICFVTKPNTQITVAAFLSVGYAFLMTATFLSIIGGIVENNTILTPTGIFLVSMGLIYIITALLHPKEFSLLIYGLLYIICVPSGYLLLTIYSLVNMHIVSWGTRESAAPKTEKKEDNKKVKYQKTCNCFCCVVEVQVHEKKSTDSEKTENKESDDSSLMAAQSQENKSLMTKQEEFVYEEGWITQLQEKSSYNVLQKEDLPEEEIPFWEDVIKSYLEPLKEDKHKQDEIERDLKSLRSKVTFVFFMINLLWIVATFFLQLIGSTVSIHYPKVYYNGTVSTTEFFMVEPVGLMFLLSFAMLLILQFLGLIYHRIYTLIHFIAYTETEKHVKHKIQDPAGQDEIKTMETDLNVYENPGAIKEFV
ncbi:chitin synthase chs-2-like isoform X1 [Xenopus tropicalis]|uniref:chitin synthase n=1 Tax=Xenopus tropicalis TaxID=8364 RepID=A0A6I8QD06_XENTR|nr:chitin synthase chs-2-like isoform X1 [Xenopus tropicalis]